MRSAVTAIAWEFWSANRHGWLLVLSAIPACALLYRLLPRPIDPSDGLQFLVFMPFVVALILTATFCNFTDPASKNNVAGFPRHLFARPVHTQLLVSCVMACAALSLVGMYIAWVVLVFEPLGIELLIRWPVTIIAAGVVLYQSIVWCLSGFRITRVVVLSLVVTCLVGVGFAPYISVPSKGQLSNRAIETMSSIALLAAATVAYAATLVTVGLQRRGAAWGWPQGRLIIERCLDRIPRRAFALHSADSALAWYEWRRSGLLLPAMVVFAAILILGPAMSISGRGPEETVRAAMWLAVLPIALAFPIGTGIAKPDLGSLDLALSPFLTVRPLNGAQVVAAKMKSAAWSTLVAWAALLAIAPLTLYATSDMEHLLDIGGMLATVYSPLSLWTIATLTLFAALLLTWSLMIGSIWMGQSGRPIFFYSLIGLALVVYLFVIFFVLVWLVDDPDERGGRFVGLLPGIPWVLAALFAVKCWSAAWCVLLAQQRRLLSNGVVRRYVCYWLVAISGAVFLGCVISPQIIWLRNTLILAALLFFPIAGIAAAPLAVAWNRHR